jgi:hypothetical protein
MKIRHGDFDFEVTAEGKFKNLVYYNPLGGQKSLGVKGSLTVQDLRDMHFPHGAAAKTLQSWLDLQKAKAEDAQRIKRLRAE